MNKLDGYRAAVRGRLTWMVLGCVLSAALVVAGFVFGPSVYGDNHMGGFIAGVQAGIFMAVLVVLGRQAYLCYRALHNDEALAQMRIRETDERMRYIRERIGGIGLDVSIFVIALGTMVSGFIDHTAFLTMLAALFAVVMIKAVLKGYFLRRY